MMLKLPPGAQRFSAAPVLPVHPPQPASAAPLHSSRPDHRIRSPRHASCESAALAVESARHAKTWTRLSHGLFHFVVHRVALPILRCAMDDVLRFLLRLARQWCVLPTRSASAGVRAFPPPGPPPAS